MSTTTETHAPTYAEIMAATRPEYEAKYGQVWDTQELQRDYEVTGFAAPFVVVRRKSDGAVGSLRFTHSPRMYFGFVADHP